MVSNPLRQIIPLQNITRNGFKEFNKWKKTIANCFIIEFESRFECGNLAAAVKITDYEFDLAL